MRLKSKGRWRKECLKVGSGESVGVPFPECRCVCGGGGRAGVGSGRHCPALGGRLVCHHLRTRGFPRPRPRTRYAACAPPLQPVQVRAPPPHPTPTHSRNLKRTGGSTAYRLFSECRGFGSGTSRAKCTSAIWARRRPSTRSSACSANTAPSGTCGWPGIRPGSPSSSSRIRETPKTPSGVSTEREYSLYYSYPCHSLTHSPARSLDPFCSLSQNAWVIRVPDHDTSVFRLSCLDFALRSLIYASNL